MWGTQLSKSIPQYGLHELFHHGRCGEWPSEHLWNCWWQPEIRRDNSHLGCKRPLVNTGDKLPTSGWFSGWVSEPSTAVWPIFWIPSCGVFHPFTWNPVISREKVIASTKQKLVFFSQMTRNHHQTLKRYLKWGYKNPHQLYGYDWCKGKPTSKLAKVLSYLHFTWNWWNHLISNESRKGTGPNSGWVSIQISGKELARRAAAPLDDEEDNGPPEDVEEAQWRIQKRCKAVTLTEFEQFLLGQEKTSTYNSTVFFVLRGGSNILAGRS